MSIEREGEGQEGGWSKGGSKGGKDQGEFTKGGQQKGTKCGKGSGKGPAGGCWTCGGPHFASDCPWTKSRTYQSGHWFPQEWGSTPTELARFIREKAKPIEACAETHNQPSYACSVHNSFEALSEALTTISTLNVGQQDANRT